MSSSASSSTGSSGLTPSDTAPGPRPTSVPGNLVRGALIGAVETVPGVSGGTVALVVGIYEQLIVSASHVISAVRALITGPDRLEEASFQLGAVRWKVVIPVLIGMVLAIFAVAGPVADTVENYPELTRAAFFGMVLASIAVPIRMAGALRLKHILAGAAAAGLAFWLVSLPPTSVEATPITIIPAAAVAVCALLLPGLSGSFLLLTFGLYEPTMRAVSDRDFGYLGLFALGMVIGGIAIVKALMWLLKHHHTMTLAVLTGVMIGALRVLWPWQDESRSLQAAGPEWGLALGLGVLGFVLVGLLVIVDARIVARHTAAQERSSSS